MKLNEIFLSIQGEGRDAGSPCIFVRTFGCNNKCNYCDTKYAVTGKDFKERKIKAIKKQIEKLKCRNICITGGEPLLWADEIEELIKESDLSRHTWWLETNGTQPVVRFTRYHNVNIVMDIKCPSSGMHQKTLMDNLYSLNRNDQVKFVIGTKEDYQFAKNIVKEWENKVKTVFLFSPAFDCDDFKTEFTPAELVEQTLKDKLSVRFSLQIHKIIWNPEERGV